jgi:hypothetical protein
VLLNNFFGRQFNSLNDIKVHPSGKLFFTDVVYVFHKLRITPSHSSLMSVMVLFLSPIPPPFPTRYFSVPVPGYADADMDS